MGEVDLDEVYEVERSAYDYPWSRGIFEDCLRVPYECEVLEENGRIVGYTVMSLAAGEAHLLNLCLAPDVHGRGLGRLLLDHVVGVAESRGANVIFLEVRPSNQRAVQLYLRAGFRRLGVRPDYYRASVGREDALVLARRF
ncbi:ribosomal protein S18-alanine N-acetyltransferase [Thioalkalivibrio sp. XN8]|nr:ribosomal protein S18-alanine N-acetyltransferase [Thioalkalivibrio sp. XN8]